MSSSEFVYDAFLSYSSKDKAVILPLAEKLKSSGLRVWIDTWEIRPGDNIPAKIEDGLERSRVLILCMSANSFGSDWTALEGQTFRFRDPSTSSVVSFPYDSMRLLSGVRFRNSHTLIGSQKITIRRTRGFSEHVVRHSWLWRRLAKA